MNTKIKMNKELSVLLALDLTEMDAVLLRYISFLCSKWPIKKLYFVHNVKRSALHNLYEDLLKEGITIEGIVERELNRNIKAHFTGSCNYELLTTSDNYTESVLTELAEQYEVDAVMAGNKSEIQGTGILTQKLVRMLDCSLLLVPETTQNRLHKVLVPTDFSTASARSFDAARSLVENFDGGIEALHVYGIPSFFFPYIDFEQALDRTKLHLDTRMQQFIKKYELPRYIKFKFVDKEESSTVEVIEEEAGKGSFDMMIISAKGANNLTKLFVGSTTNDMLLRDRVMPLLVIK
ncbi:universal stress protein [Pelobium manganitolerans]|nr:universal stress protein [Pelobium manganitolerans]